MGSFFATVSGTFTKPVIIGMLFPTLLFLVFLSLFVAPMVPWELQILTRIAALDGEWKLAAFTLAAVVIVVFLYTLNITILRWYQGYPWRNGLIGDWLVQRNRGNLEWQLALLPHLDNCRKALRRDIETAKKKIEAEADPKEREKKRKALAALEEYQWEQLDKGQRIIVERGWFEYPKAPSVLPTRFGNVLRSFENYSYRQYGIAAVPMWPRLRAKIDSGYAASIDEAKAQVDLAVNLSLLSAILFVVVAALGLLFPVPFATPQLLGQWLLKLVVTAAAAVLLYRVAIDRAMDWGNLVRGAFDLYRRDVLKALGFKQEPRTLREERTLWSAISRQYGYGDPVDPNAATLEFDKAPAPAAPPLRVQPAENIHLARGVTPLAGGVRTVYTRVENRGTASVSVVLTDTLPAHQQYIWGSARVGAAAVTPAGVNPYEFALTVPAKDSVLLDYQVSETPPA